MKSKNRVSDNLINEKKPIKFSFNNDIFYGYEGDTLASALIHNEKKIVARSFKYHRPRGIFSAGSEEPNALVNVYRKGCNEPNVKATTLEIHNGLKVYSQNHLGSLEFDLLQINDFFSSFLSAGFYYKTFMWPKKFWEKVYEPLIRSAAGLGSISNRADPDIYDKGFLHCEILIIGSGPSALLSCLIAAKSGASVILVEEDFMFGGKLLAENEVINNEKSIEWVKKTIKELKTFKNVKLMKRTTLYGVFDHGVLGALERKTDHLPDNNNKPKQILWKIFTKKTLVCSGSNERGLVFGNNDKPGIMLLSAIKAYVNRWGVIPGKKILIFTNNDYGISSAKNLIDKGCKVVGIVDTRKDIKYEINNVSIFKGKYITNTSGFNSLKSVTLDDGTKIETDCLGISGGWNPNLHLTCHHGSRPIWNDEKKLFIPRNLPKNMFTAGSINGNYSTLLCFEEAKRKMSIILKEIDKKEKKITIPSADNTENINIGSFFFDKKSKGKCWVDLQNDVTSKDIIQSNSEGFESVEHLKRYTTLGMATDQGKNSNVLGLLILSDIQKKSIDDVGTTIFRPPYTPVSIGAFAGRSRGKDFKPIRLTPSHNWAVEKNAVFVETGNWLRAQWFPIPGETHWRESVDREVLGTRNSVGICDVTTLGKIDIKGKDCGEFLNRVYANNFGKLAIGKVRYGLMLREDGIAYDDGTTARLGENHFVMTTTTANAVTVFRNLEFFKQCLWPELDVHLISTTDAWAQFAIAGPNSRKLLEKIVDKSYDISNESFPFMACTNLTICNGIPARLFRISFSGELAYELAVSRKFGDSLVRVLMKAGKEINVTPYGTEALGVMRIEKGHAAGNELTGQTSAQNLGMSKMINKNNDCIGNVLSERTNFNDENIQILMGFIPVNKDKNLTAGSHLFSIGKKFNLDNDEGWLTSVAFSPTLGHSIGLGYLKSGSERKGEKIMSVDLLNNNTFEVEVVSPHFVDPEGARLRV